MARGWRGTQSGQSAARPRSRRRREVRAPQAPTPLPTGVAWSPYRGLGGWGRQPGVVSGIDNGPSKARNWPHNKGKNAEVAGRLKCYEVDRAGEQSVEAGPTHPCRLAEFLLRSLETMCPRRSRLCGSTRAERRARSWDAGEVEGMPAEQVMLELGSGFLVARTLVQQAGTQ